MGLALHILTLRSYVVNLGEVISTSSPVSNKLNIAKAILSCTPAVTTISFSL